LPTLVQRRHHLATVTAEDENETEFVLLGITPCGWWCRCHRRYKINSAARSARRSIPSAALTFNGESDENRPTSMKTSIVKIVVDGRDHCRR
jgi:hypothetical protein